MDAKILRKIFAFKLMYYRKKRGFSFPELERKSGISKSHLNEIEHEKKNTPSLDRIQQLAKALGISYEELISTDGEKEIRPIVNFLKSDFFSTFPMKIFGIKEELLTKLLSHEPKKFAGFIATLQKLSRSLHLSHNEFFRAAMRSYQDIHDNYFEDVENEVLAFTSAHSEIGIDADVISLEVFLKEKYGIHIDSDTLSMNESLGSVRSYYSQKNRRLYISTKLSPSQRKFLLIREVAIRWMKLSPRPLETPAMHGSSFELLIHHFKASYFAAAFLMPQDELYRDMLSMAQMIDWESDTLISLLGKYDVTPETLFYRMVNIFVSKFKFNNLFFVRLEEHPNDFKRFSVTKELHIGKLHQPYSTDHNEHYCRRWISVNLIRRLQVEYGDDTHVIADTQISHYQDTPNKYLCISIALRRRFEQKKIMSITIGILIDEHVRSVFRFLNSPELRQRVVHTTCESCPISDCNARAVPPYTLKQVRRKDQIIKALDKL